MADVFFTGCTHFGHANIIKHANRPFIDVDEMNGTLITNWNKTVKPEDTVYHLGDFAYRGRHPEFYLQYLHGNIIRVQGNHDPAHWGKDFMQFKLAGKKWNLFHYPIEEWDGWFRGSLHVHCHTHKPELVSAERRFNVTVEACDYRPIHAEDLIARI